MDICFFDKQKISVTVDVFEKDNSGDEYLGTDHLKYLPLGTMTLDFIETDFNNFVSFQGFITIWGLSGFIAYSENAKNVVGTERDFKEDEYTRILHEIHEEVKDKIISAQDEIKHVAYTCLDYNGPDWSRGLTSKQRHYIMIETWNGSNFETRDYNNRVTIKYYTELSKDLQKKVFYSENSLSEGDLAKLILNDNPVFVEVYGSEDIASLCLIEIKEMLANGTMIKKCKNCNRYFLNSGKKEYCDRTVFVDSNGTPRTCQMIGPKKAFLDNPAKKVYSKAYRTLHNRLKKGGKYRVNKDELDFWRAAAKAKLEEVEKGEITLEEFSQWLADTIKSFREWIKEGLQWQA